MRHGVLFFSACRQRQQNLRKRLQIPSSINCLFRVAACPASCRVDSPEHKKEIARRQKGYNDDVLAEPSATVRRRFASGCSASNFLAYSFPSFSRFKLSICFF